MNKNNEKDLESFWDLKKTQSELKKLEKFQGKEVVKELSKDNENKSKNESDLRQNLSTVASQKTSAQSSNSVIKSKELKAIESVLEEDLKDIYQKMSPAKKMEFKSKGEITAVKISKIVEKTKFKVFKIYKLIIDWLKLIPGVNKFFLEKAAKIKTDKILNAIGNKKDE